MYRCFVLLLFSKLSCWLVVVKAKVWASAHPLCLALNSLGLYTSTVFGNIKCYSALWAPRVVSDLSRLYNKSFDWFKWSNSYFESANVWFSLCWSSNISYLMESSNYSFFNANESTNSFLISKCVLCLIACKFFFIYIMFFFLFKYGLLSLPYFISSFQKLFVLLIWLFYLFWAALIL